MEDKEMFHIKDGESLTSIHRYELRRINDTLEIDTHEVLAGKSEDRFFAVPKSLHRGYEEVDPKYIGYGASEREALQDCLDKIEDVPLQIIIPPPV